MLYSSLKTQVIQYLAQLSYIVIIYYHFLIIIIIIIIIIGFFSVLKDGKSVLK